MATDERTRLLDNIQKAVARMVATSPAGHKLLLIGGFRYRLLDQSVRTSKDIDYHWSGDLTEKQQELLFLFRKRLLPLVRRQFGYDGRADAATGPDAESPVVSVVILAFWKTDVEYSRIEIPVEITRVLCADQTEVRTVDGVVYPTLSDADLIESKIVAVFNRRIMEHRDLVDVFLFGNELIEESPRRLARKLRAVGVTVEDCRTRLDDLEKHVAYHTKAVQTVIDGQLDLAAARNVNAAGGGAIVLAKAREILMANVAVKGIRGARRA